MSSLSSAFAFLPNRLQIERALLPAASLLRRKLFRQQEPPLESLAERSWEIAPAATWRTRPAYYLPNQLERVTGWVYMEDPRQEMLGGLPARQWPTRAFLVRDAWMVDGAIYKGNARTFLSRRTERLPHTRVEVELDRAALSGTYDGLTFFGLWLTDDCTLYPLAEAEGVPITTDLRPSPHMRDYEAWLGLRPERVHAARLREVVVFQDLHHNLDKGRRFQAMRERLLARFDARPHPGVFILRRTSGKRRILHNEVELAEQLRERRGFRIVDVTRDDLATILAACAGARVVAGVEGSHLMHGVVLLARGASVLTLQPPDRFCSVLKRTLDRDGQHFGFVVGHTAGDGFCIDEQDVERTLDLLPTPGVDDRSGGR
jgi:hypothetical protein